MIYTDVPEHRAAVELLLYKMWVLLLGKAGRGAAPQALGRAGALSSLFGASHEDGKHI